MDLGESIRRLWRTRDELSPRNFRAGLWAVFLVFPLSVIIGDLRYLDQEMALWGIDSNTLMLVMHGLGWLVSALISRRKMVPVLRVAVLLACAMLPFQIFMASGLDRLWIYLGFHFLNGVCCACGFFLFCFTLNNVERLFTMALAQAYYAFIYVFWSMEPVAAFLKTFGSAAVMLVLLAAAFAVKPTREAPAETRISVRESGVGVVAGMDVIYFVVMLMARYIEYDETTVSSLLFGIGAFAAVAMIFVIQLLFNRSSMHLWSVFLFCSALGLGILLIDSAAAVNAGSFFYGLGEGLGYMILPYLYGGAIKRGGNYKLFRLVCVVAFVEYSIISGAFDYVYANIDAPNYYIAFAVVFALTLVCFMLMPLLQKRLFDADWTDGYHMADMPRYARELAEVERIDRTNSLNLTPREREIFTLLLTEAMPKEIASALKVSYATVNFHTQNLYRKLNIQSRTELLAQYANKEAVSPCAVGPGSLPL